MRIIHLFTFLFILIASYGCLQNSDNSKSNKEIEEVSLEQQKLDLRMKKEFLELCDSSYLDVVAQTKVTERLGAWRFYRDSYVVGALCVVFDMMGKQEYFDTCELWSDRMIEFEKQMIPEGHTI